MSEETEQKKRKYEEKLSDVEARLTEVQERIARAKKDTEEFTCAIKAKLAEYESATIEDVKKQIGAELSDLAERLKETKRLFEEVAEWRVKAEEGACCRT